MKRFLFSLCLASLGVAPTTRAQEVVATTAARPQPVTVSSTGTAGSVTVYRGTAPESGWSMPAVQLGKPRVFRPAEEPSGIQRVSYQIPEGVEPSGVAAPAESGSFAIERTAFFAFAEEADKPPMMDKADKSDAPKPTEALKFAPKSPAAELLYDERSQYDFTEDDEAPLRFYGSIEYLLWQTKKANVPPLVTTSEPADNGVIGAPTTRILFGSESLDYGWQHGGRLRLGYRLPTERPLAVEASFFFLASNAVNFAAGSDQFPVIQRPFFSLNQGIPSTEAVAFPGVFTGRVDINAPSNLWGADQSACSLWCNSSCMGNLNLDVLGGFRFLRLNDKVSITEQGIALVTDPTRGAIAGQSFRFNDTFETRNDFYGGQVGVEAEWKRGDFSVGLRQTIALGVTHQSIDVSGSALLFNPDDAAQGALLTGPSNIGEYSRNRFSFVPETTLTLGYQVTNRLKATVGFNFLYWSNVVRAGDQIDTGLDETQIPFFPAQGGAASRPGPVVPFKDTSYWAQGLNLGLEFRY